MSKQEAKKVAEQFVMKHKQSFKSGDGGVTDKEIKAAVHKVARALAALSPAQAQRKVFT
jgi:hypothetical protein